jgi:hypothetical protein
MKQKKTLKLSSLSINTFEIISKTEMEQLRGGLLYGNFNKISTSTTSRRSKWTIAETRAESDPMGHNKSSKLGT